MANEYFEYTDTPKGSVQPRTTRLAVDRATGAQLVSQVNAPSPEGFGIKEYDKAEIAHVAAGDGEGEIETITYLEGGDTVAVLTFSYDGEGRLTSVVKS